MRRLARWYSLRIVNVNVNVMLSGILGGMLTVGPVHMTRYVGIHGETAITAVALVSDVVFDVIIYYCLHWLANHWPKRGTAEGTAFSFMRDATLVQFERAALAPVYYGIFLGLTHVMLGRDTPREWAVLLALICGIATTRVLHTFWMIHQGRRARLRALSRADALVPARTIPAPRRLEVVERRSDVA